MYVGQQHVKQNFYSNSELFTAYRQRVALLYNHYKAVTLFNLLQYHNVPLINEALWTANNILFTSSSLSHAGWMLERWQPWIIYLYLSFINYLHTRALSDRLLSTAGLQATFSCVFSQFLGFSPYEQYILIHDESSLCFHGLTDLSIQKQRKTQASWVSATDSYGEKITSCPQAAFRATAMTSCANNLLALNRHHARINCIYFLQLYTL